MVNKLIDWTQTLTIIASIIGLGYFLNTIHREDVRLMREDMRIAREEHREDLKSIEERWNKLFEKFHILDKEVATIKGSASCGNRD